MNKRLLAMCIPAQALLYIILVHLLYLVENRDHSPTKSKGIVALIVSFGVKNLKRPFFIQEPVGIESIGVRESFRATVDAIYIGKDDGAGRDMITHIMVVLKTREIIR
jgi:hypothetical protein